MFLYNFWPLLQTDCFLKIAPSNFYIFLNFSSFLSLTPFGNSCTKFFILDIIHRPSGGESKIF